MPKVIHFDNIPMAFEEWSGRPERVPLLRFWRRLNLDRSALAISFDMDAMTLWDFDPRGYWFL
jgi:hypothetical protein